LASRAKVKTFAATSLPRVSRLLVACRPQFPCNRRGKTSALWVNIQEQAAKLRDDFAAAETQQ
jgi:hypothetical protein